MADTVATPKFLFSTMQRGCWISLPAVVFVVTLWQYVMTTRNPMSGPEMCLFTAAFLLQIVAGIVYYDFVIRTKTYGQLKALNQKLKQCKFMATTGKLYLKVYVRLVLNATVTAPAMVAMSGLIVNVMCFIGLAAFSDLQVIVFDTTTQYTGPTFIEALCTKVPTVNVISVGLPFFLGVILLLLARTEPVKYLYQLVCRKKGAEDYDPEVGIVEEAIDEDADPGCC